MQSKKKSFKEFAIERKDVDKPVKDNNFPPIKKETVTEAKEVKISPEDHLHPVEKIDFLFKRDFPDLKRNVITGEFENVGGELSQEEINSTILDFKVETKGITETLFFLYLNSNKIQSYNPVKGFFLSNAKLKPTGLIDKLAATIVSDTGMRDDEFCPDYTQHFLKKWMVGAVAMVFGKGTNMLMLILAGEKQNTGKTTWLRKLVPQELAAYSAEPKGIDDMKEAELGMLMVENFIILDDEMQNRRWRDWKKMKSLLSSATATIRRPYDKRQRKYERLGSLCSTTNNLDLLGDPTGNRRLIPINVIEINHVEYNELDKKLLWMEAYHLMLNGYNFELTQKDIEILNQNTKNFEIVDEIIELIEEYYEPPNKEAIGRFTSTQVSVYLGQMSHIRHGLPANQVGQRLRKMGYEQRRQDSGGSRTWCINKKTTFA